jgi:hypothetical protein
MTLPESANGPLGRFAAVPRCVSYQRRARRSAGGAADTAALIREVKPFVATCGLRPAGLAHGATRISIRCSRTLRAERENQVVRRTGMMRLALPP